jgi:hypothetical protein
MDEPHDVTTPRHTLERDDHVLDLPVEARGLARAARCYPATNRAAENRRRKVTEREPFAFERLFEGKTHMTRFDRDGATLALELAHGRHTLEVYDDGVWCRQDRSADAASSAEWHERYPAFRRETHELRYFVR